MKNAMKAMFMALLQGMFVSCLFVGVFFSGQANAVMPIGNENVVAAQGWDMRTCNVPFGPNSTAAIYFRDGEIVNMPLHINKQDDNPDIADIFISGNPIFLQKVKMGEDRYTSDGSDKYSSYMSLFQGGIIFDQPDSNIGDETAVQKMADRFHDSTLPAYQITPAAPASSIFGSKSSAVQLEFFVDANGIGKVRIDPNCTVELAGPGPYDYNIVSGSNPMSFQKYNLYAYHYKKTSDPYIVVPVTDTYVTQDFSGYTCDPVGQIYVNGNVIIGGGEDANFTDINNMVANGKIFVIATGNIWVADSILVDGTHDVNGMPAADNPNFLG